MEPKVLGLMCAVAAAVAAWNAANRIAALRSSGYDDEVEPAVAAALEPFGHALPSFPIEFAPPAPVTATFEATPVPAAVPADVEEAAETVVATAEVAPRPQPSAIPVVTVIAVEPDPDWPAEAAWVQATAERADADEQPLHPEQAVYSEISNLRERLADEEGAPPRHGWRLGRRAT
jgi:hypothetical protein